MKQILKFLSLFIVLSGFLFFTGCEEDNISYDEPKQFGPKHGGPASYLKGEDAEAAKMLLNSVLDNSMNRSWTVDFNEVLMVTDTVGNKNYTFRVVHPNSVPKEFYNLVLTENSMTGYAAVKLVRYVMSENFAERFYSGTSTAAEFSGTITFTPVGDKQQVLPIVQPGEDPVPDPEPEPDPCEDEIIIEVPDNPGAPGGAIGGGGKGGGSTGGGGGNGGPIPHNDLSLTDCFEWITIPCTGDGSHTGNDPSCKGTFQGATYLVNTCNNTVSNIYGRNVVVRDPCAPVGNIGVLFPSPIFCDSPIESFNNYYSASSPCKVDLSLVRPECEDGTVDPAKEKFMCVYNKLIQSPAFKELFLDIFDGDQTQINVKFEIASSVTVPQNPSQQVYAKCIFPPPSSDGVINTTIVINRNFLLQNTSMAGSNIYIAKVILHECIHAFLGVKSLNPEFGMTLSGINNSDFGQLLNDCYPNESQHNFMFDNMIELMNNCLDEIDQLLITEANYNYFSSDPIMNPNLGVNEPWSWTKFFTNINMQGLENSQGFISNVSNNPTNQFLFNVYNSSALQMTKECQN